MNLNLRPIFPVNETINQNNYYWFDKGFTPVDVDFILEKSKDYPYSEAGIINQATNDSIRKSNIKWLPFDETWSWVYERIMQYSAEANKTIWNFNLHTIIDQIQFTEYIGAGGHYDWHTDIGPNSISHRKISIIIQLTDSTDYEGGELQLKSSNVEIIAPRTKGSVILFPSFMLHRITPLLSGERRRLVLWGGGDHYR